MEEPVQQSTDVINEVEKSTDNAGDPGIDYAKILAEHLKKPFEQKKGQSLQPIIQLKKKSYEELVAQIENDSDSDDDDYELIQVHASVGERSIRPITNVPLIRAFNLAESRLEAAGKPGLEANKKYKLNPPVLQ